MVMNLDPFITQMIHPQLDGHGYLTVKGAGLVHRLVLRAFVGACPPGQVCRHLNGDKKDNRLSNLAWGTLLENRQDRTRHDRERGFDVTKHCPSTHPFTGLRCPTCHAVCGKCQNGSWRQERVSS